MSDTATAGSSATSAASLSGLLARSITRHERVFVAVAGVVFGLSAAYHAFTAPLWFDEFFTLFLSRLSSVPEMLRAIPADGLPPLQYLLTHVFVRLLGETEFGVRALELICYLAAGLLAYWIVRRHGTAVQALFAMVFLMGSSISRSHAATARPYELLVAFTALTFACWQLAAAKENNRRLALCGVAFGVASSILSHHFGIIHTGLFLAAGDAVRGVQRRRLDGWMLTAIGAGMLALVITLPLAHQSNLMLGQPVQHSAFFWARPKAADLATYLLMVPLGLILYIVLFGLLMQLKRMDQSGNEAVLQVPAYEWAAAGTLCLLLPVLLALAFTKTGYFQPKYAIGTTLGLALAGGWGIPRLPWLRRIAQPMLALSALVFLLVLARESVSDQIHDPALHAQPGKSAVSPLLLSASGDLPIVVSNAFDYIPEWWYSPSTVRRRLIYLSDVSFAVRQPDFLPELSLVFDNRYTPLPVSDYATFVGNHQQFLLLASGEPRLVWLPARLSEAGWRLTPMAKSGRDVLYLAGRM